MKNIYYILLFSSLFYNSFSQSWFPIGATWHYQLTPQSWYKLEVIKDTIVDNGSAKLLRLTDKGVQKINDLIFKESNDSLFYFNRSTNQYHLVYNMSAKKGDTIVVHDKPTVMEQGIFVFAKQYSCFKYKVDSIDIVTINGISLRRQFVSGVDDFWCDVGFFNTPGRRDTIIERIGSLTYILGRDGAWILSTPGTQDLLRCYKDNQGLEFLNYRWEYACDSSVSVKNISLQEEVSVYPNPTQRIFVIELKEEIGSLIEILNSTGQTIAKYSDVDYIVQNLKQYPNGIFYVKILLKNGALVTKKIIKD